jgi:2-hydroxy-3-oxopropionate reductase
MAVNLVRAGHTVRAFSRGAHSRQVAAAQGVPIVESIADAVSNVEFVVTMLPDTPDVEQVTSGDDGILANISRDALYIDMSTISPRATRELSRQFAEIGVGMLDAPVSGGEGAAIDGSLSIMVGGLENDLETAKPVLRSFGTTIVRVGDAGAGQVVKAANQIMVAGHLQMLAEALIFLRAHDVDGALALSVIGEGLAGSTVIARKQNSFLGENFTPGFRVSLHHKDLGIAQRAARERGIALPATALVAELVQSLVAQGFGDLDHSALYLLAEQINAPSTPDFIAVERARMETANEH